MTTWSVAIRASGLYASLMLITLSPRPAAAFHVKGISVSPTSINSATRTVTVDILESTVGTGSPHVAANVQWGDAVTSNKAWTATSGVGPKLYSVSGVAHIYPDLTTRLIQVRSDCCNSSLNYDTDIAVVDFGCSDLPMGVCDGSATKSQLQLKNNATDSKDKLKFKWLKGSVASFEDPTGTAEYYLCIYAPTLVLQAIVPAVTNWSATGSGFKYQEDTGAAGGVTKIKLKAGTGGKAKILINGKGTNLGDPAMPLTQPVLVQLQNNDGQCWQHLFTSPEIKNTSDQFKDKEP